jgi:DNA-binding MarR family transcriptional regulator
MSEPVKMPTNDAARVMKSIRRIVRAIDMRSKRVARETGLTIPQLVILQAVNELGKVTTGALSRHADLSPATTVIILDKLESRGLVTRRRSAEDRRVVHTELTEQGARTVRTAPPLVDGIFAESLADLPEADQHKITEAFATVANLLDPTALDVPHQDAI